MRKSRTNPNKSIPEKKIVEVLDFLGLLVLAGLFMSVIFASAYFVVSV